MNKTALNESLADDIKEELIEYLGEEGYATYSRRLRQYKFIIADKYHGHYIDVAAMFPSTNEIVINPSMLDSNKMAVKSFSDKNNTQAIRNKVQNDKRTIDEKKMEQLSVLIRHELLHFLLVHSKRLLDLIKTKHPEWKKLNFYALQDLANYAEDYEISLDGYDDHDKEVVRLMTLNNEVVGGLIAEDDHPEWGKKTMEEMLELIVAKAIEDRKNAKPKTKIIVQKDSHSPEYVKMYNDILHLLDDKKYSDGDLAMLLSQAVSDDDVVDSLSGTTLLAKGE